MADILLALDLDMVEYRIYSEETEFRQPYTFRIYPYRGIRKTIHDLVRLYRDFREKAKDYVGLFLDRVECGYDWGDWKEEGVRSIMRLVVLPVVNSFLVLIIFRNGGGLVPGI